MSMYVRYFVAILIMALVTYIPRALPLAFFTKQIKSKFVKSFLYYVPYAVLASLTFPGIFYCTDNMLAAVAGTVIAIVLSFFNCNLVTVAIAAVVTVFLSNMIF